MLSLSLLHLTYGEFLASFQQTILLMLVIWSLNSIWNFGVSSKFKKKKTQWEDFLWVHIFKIIIQKMFVAIIQTFMRQLVMHRLKTFTFLRWIKFSCFGTESTSYKLKLILIIANSSSIAGWAKCFKHLQKWAKCRMQGLILHVSDFNYYLLDSRVLLGNTPLVKFIETTSRSWVAYFLYPHYWRYRWFNHWFQVTLPLKLYLNLMVYDQNIFRSPWKVFSNLQKFFIMLCNVCVYLQTSFKEFLAIFGKWSKIFKKNSACYLKDMMKFMFSWQDTVLVLMARYCAWAQLKHKTPILLLATM